MKKFNDLRFVTLCILISTMIYSLFNSANADMGYAEKAANDLFFCKPCNYLFLDTNDINVCNNLIKVKNCN